MNYKLYTTQGCTACVPCKNLVKDNNLPVEVISDFALFPMGIKSVPALAMGEKIITGGGRVMKELQGMLSE